MFSVILVLPLSVLTRWYVDVGVASDKDPRISLDVDEITVSRFREAFPDIIYISSADVFGSSSATDLYTMGAGSNFYNLMTMGYFYNSSTFSFNSYSISYFANS